MLHTDEDQPRTTPVYMQPPPPPSPPSSTQEADAANTLASLFQGHVHLGDSNGGSGSGGGGDGGGGGGGGGDSSRFSESSQTPSLRGDIISQPAIVNVAPVHAPPPPYYHGSYYNNNKNNNFNAPAQYPAVPRPSLSLSGVSGEHHSGQRAHNLYFNQNPNSIPNYLPEPRVAAPGAIGRGSSALIGGSENSDIGTGGVYYTHTPFPSRAVYHQQQQHYHNQQYHPYFSSNTAIASAFPASAATDSASLPRVVPAQAPPISQIHFPQLHQQRQLHQHQHQHQHQYSQHQHQHQYQQQQHPQHQHPQQQHPQQQHPQHQHPQQQHPQPIMSTSSSRSTSPDYQARHSPSPSPSPSPLPSSPEHNTGSSTASSRIRVIHPSSTIATARALSQHDHDPSDSDRTESDRPQPTDSEETEEEEYPYIPPPRQTSSTPISITVAAPVAVPVIIGGQRGVAKAVKKGARKSAAGGGKRAQREGSLSTTTGAPKKKAAAAAGQAAPTAKGRKKGVAVATKAGGKKKRKVEAEEVEEDHVGDEDDGESYHARSPSLTSTSPNPTTLTLQNGTGPALALTPNGAFPTTPTSSFPPGPYDPSLPLYCICRRPDSGKWMIACDGCDDWFHGECISIPESDGDLIESYFCPDCTRLGRGETSWKRKCRLPECRRPAAVDGPGGGKSGGGGANGWGGGGDDGGGTGGWNGPSKYCCQDHGITFFERVLAAAGRSKLPKGVLASVVSGAETGSEFHSLGERMPTPPPPDGIVELDLGTGDAAAAQGSLLSTEEERKKLHLAKPYPEVYVSLKSIHTQLRQLETRVKPLLQLRVRYIEFCWARRARIIEQMKEEAVRAAGGDLHDEQDGGITAATTTTAGKKKGKKAKGGGKGGSGGARWDICGYDSRLGWGDDEFLAWVEKGRGQGGEGEVDDEKGEEEGMVDHDHDSSQEKVLLDYTTLLDFDFSKLDESDKGSGAIIYSESGTTAGGGGGGGEGVSTVVTIICTKKKCPKHQAWQKVRFEECQLEERICEEKVLKLREEEGKVWEGLKRRIWREREGSIGVGVEGKGDEEGDGGWVVKEGEEEWGRGYEEGGREWERERWKGRGGGEEEEEESEVERGMVRVGVRVG